MRYVTALLCTMLYMACPSVGHAMDKVKIATGQTITCDSRYCAKFKALIADFVAHGYRPRSVVCFAHGHTPGSNHDGGGACDIDQRAKNRTDRFMYTKLANALIRAHGLFTGCSYRDCGHVEGLRGLCNYGQCGSMSARRHLRRGRRVAAAPRSAERYSPAQF